MSYEKPDPPEPAPDSPSPPPGSSLSLPPPPDPRLLPPPPQASGSRPTRRASTIVVAAVAVLAVLGAGTAGAVHWRNTRPLPKAEYLARANVICAKLYADTKALASTINSSSLTFDQWPEVFDSTGNLVDQAVRDLRALPAPDGDGDTLTSSHD